MTLCVIDGKQCQCQPDDGQPCTAGTPAQVQAALNAESMRLRAALAELVACKDLKEWLGKPGSAGEQFNGRDFEAGEAVAEYRRRRPLAWTAARAALGGPNARLSG